MTGSSAVRLFFSTRVATTDGGVAAHVGVPELSHTEVVQARIDAHPALFPELDQFLVDEVDPGLEIAQQLGMTPATYEKVTGRALPSRIDLDGPQAWLGHMLLRVLGEPSPMTRGSSSRLYSATECDYFWAHAQSLADELDPGNRARLAARSPDRGLRSAVRARFGERSVFTITGRLRARASFNGSRNTVFQGAAADGAILGLWRVWRAGYPIVNFVHDQVVVEVADDGQIPNKVSEVTALLRQGMAEVLPGMQIGIDARVTRSLNKADVHLAPGREAHRHEAIPIFGVEGTAAI